MKPVMIIDKDGTKRWKLNGLRHREDGPAIEYTNGTKKWAINGVFHREDGPAIEYVNGDKQWWINGKLHREDGPAIEYADSGRGYDWFINGKVIILEQVIKYCPDGYGPWTASDLAKFKLKYL